MTITRVVRLAANMSHLPGLPSSSSSGGPGIGASEAFVVLVVDTVSHSSQLLNAILSSILFGASCSGLCLSCRESSANAVVYSGRSRN